MFSCSEYYSIYFYPQRCLDFQNIFLILRDVWMFRVLFLFPEMFSCSEYYSYSQRGTSTKPPHSLHTLWHTVASSPLGDYDDYDDHDDDDDDADHYDEDEGHDSLNESLYGLEVS